MKIVSQTFPKHSGGSVYISDPRNLTWLTAACIIHCPDKYRGEVVFQNEATGLISFHPTFSTNWYNSFRKRATPDKFYVSGLSKLSPQATADFMAEVEKHVVILTPV